MATTNALLTAEEFFGFPDLGAPAELVRGQVVMMNVPGYRHGYICVNIAFELRDYLRNHDVGRVVSNDAGIITHRDPDSVRGADVAFYSYERLPKASVPQGYPPVKPELVFEVRSPSDSWKDVLAKVAEYLQAGVATVCVVDPETESVIAYYADKKERACNIDDALTLPDVLPGFSVPVRKLFHA